MAAGAAISVEQAIARFKERYPTGFEDERYVTLERGWKSEKHVEWHERVGTRSLGEMAQTNLRQLAHDTQRVVQTRRKSLLDKAELTAFTAGLAVDAPSRAFFAAVDAVLSAGDDDTAAFTALCDAAAGVLAAGGAARTHSWPVTTVVPALARPDRFMYVKPAGIRKGIDSSGSRVGLQSRPECGDVRRADGPQPYAAASAAAPWRAGLHRRAVLPLRHRRVAHTRVASSPRGSCVRRGGTGAEGVESSDIGGHAHDPAGRGEAGPLL